MVIRYAGMAFMVGVVLVIVASAFTPGTAIINPVDQTDFEAARDALGDAAIVSHWMTFLNILGLLALAFGALGLYALGGRQAGLGGRLLQFGIIVSVIEWSILIIGAGMRHFEIHLMQRATLPDESVTPAEFQAAALNMHVGMAGVILTFIVLYPLATMALVYGLSTRFGSMNIYKGASYVMAATGVAGLVIFLTAMNAPELGVRTLFGINSVFLYIASISLFIIGYGMYKERKEFAEEGGSS